MTTAKRVRDTCPFVGRCVIQVVYEAYMATNFDAHFKNKTLMNLFKRLCR
jgi:hypothetical protein